MAISTIEKCMEQIVENIRVATMNWDLFCNIKKSQEEYVKHMNQTKHFWSVTLNSYLDATRLYLCKIYDKQNKSLNKSRLSLIDCLLIDRMFDCPDSNG